MNITDVFQNIHSTALTNNRSKVRRSELQ